MITIIIDLSQASPVQLEQYFQHTEIQRAIQTLSAVDKGVSIQVKVLQARTSPPSQESGRRGYLRLRRNKSTTAGPTAHQSTLERDIEQQAEAPIDELHNPPQQPVTIKYRHRRQAPPLK